MSFVEIEREYIRRRILPDFDWVVCRSPSRINPLAKPVAEARIALVATAGAHLSTDQAFDLSNPTGDPSFRIVPADARSDTVRLSHRGYNTQKIQQDIDCVFPLERLKELAQEGIIGDVSPRHFSFMGYIPVTAPLIEKTAPAVADMLQEDQVDLALLVPA